MRTGESSLLEPGGHKTGAGEPAKHQSGFLFVCFKFKHNSFFSPCARPERTVRGSEGGGGRVLMKSGSFRF